MVSPACKDLVGYEQEEVLGRNLADLYAEPRLAETTLQEFHRRRGQSVHVETALRYKEGHVVWCPPTPTPLRPGRPVYRRGGHHAGHHTAQAAGRPTSLPGRPRLFDGVLNRKGFTEQLVRAVVACRRESVQLSLVDIDLDGFKGVNDRLGHRAGDRALVDVAGACGTVFGRPMPLPGSAETNSPCSSRERPHARQLNNLVERFSATLAQTLDPSGERSGSGQCRRLPLPERWGYRGSGRCSVPTPDITPGIAIGRGGDAPS